MNATDLFVPQLGVNDDAVTVREWTVAPGSSVRAGDSVALLETSKATFTLEADRAGYLFPVVDRGSEVPVRAVLAILTDDPDPTAGEARAAARRQAIDRAAAGDTRSSGLELTAKARELVLATGIDISSLPTDRVIRERDVRALLERRQVSASGPGNRRIVAVYGASDGGASLAESLGAMGDYEVRAFVDDTPRLIGTSLDGVPVVSGQHLDRLAGMGIGALVSHIAVREFRLTLRARAQAAGLALINVIHPSAFVASSVQMGSGNVIKAGAVIDTGVRIGDCCIVDNGVVVAHHNVIHDACHLAPGVVMGGACHVGERTLIGVGSTISSRIHVGRNVIVRPGSVVVTDLPDDVVAGGNPARVTGERR